MLRLLRHVVGPQRIGVCLIEAQLAVHVGPRVTLIVQTMECGVRHVALVALSGDLALFSFTTLDLVLLVQPLLVFLVGGLCVNCGIDGPAGTRSLYGSSASTGAGASLGVGFGRAGH